MGGSAPLNFESGGLKPPLPPISPPLTSACSISHQMFSKGLKSHDWKCCLGKHCLYPITDSTDFFAPMNCCHKSRNLSASRLLINGALVQLCQTVKRAKEVHVHRNVALQPAGRKRSLWDVHQVLTKGCQWYCH